MEATILCTCRGSARACRWSGASARCACAAHPARPPRAPSRGIAARAARVKMVRWQDGKMARWSDGQMTDATCDRRMARRARAVVIRARSGASRASVAECAPPRANATRWSRILRSSAPD
eukprot:scaffold85973_cov29-Phaeocystis_antarctica.AAC.1